MKSEKHGGSAGSSGVITKGTNISYLLVAAVAFAMALGIYLYYQGGGVVQLEAGGAYYNCGDHNVNLAFKACEPPNSDLGKEYTYNGVTKTCKSFSMDGGNLWCNENCYITLDKCFKCSGLDECFNPGAKSTDAGAASNFRAATTCGGWTSMSGKGPFRPNGYLYCNDQCKIDASNCQANPNNCQNGNWDNGENCEFIGGQWMFKITSSSTPVSVDSLSCKDFYVNPTSTNVVEQMEKYTGGTLSCYPKDAEKHCTLNYGGCTRGGTTSNVRSCNDKYVAGEKPACYDTNFKLSSGNYGSAQQACLEKTDCRDSNGNSVTCNSGGGYCDSASCSPVLDCSFISPPGIQTCGGCDDTAKKRLAAAQKAFDDAEANRKQLFQKWVDAYTVHKNLYDRWASALESYEFGGHTSTTSADDVISLRRATDNALPAVKLARDNYQGAKSSTATAGTELAAAKAACPGSGTEATSSEGTGTEPGTTAEVESCPSGTSAVEGGCVCTAAPAVCAAVGGDISTADSPDEGSTSSASTSGTSTTATGSGANGCCLSYSSVSDIKSSFECNPDVGRYLNGKNIQTAGDYKSACGSLVGQGACESSSAKVLCKYKNPGSIGEQNADSYSFESALGGNMACYWDSSANCGTTSTGATSVTEDPEVVFDGQYSVDETTAVVTNAEDAVTEKADELTAVQDSVTSEVDSFADEINNYLNNYPVGSNSAESDSAWAEMTNRMGLMGDQLNKEAKAAEDLAASAAEAVNLNDEAIKELMGDRNAAGETLPPNAVPDGSQKSADEINAQKTQNANQIDVQINDLEGLDSVLNDLQTGAQDAKKTADDLTKILNSIPDSKPGTAEDVDKIRSVVNSLRPGVQRMTDEARLKELEAKLEVLQAKSESDKGPPRESPPLQFSPSSTATGVFEVMGLQDNRVQLAPDQVAQVGPAPVCAMQDNGQNANNQNNNQGQHVINPNLANGVTCTKDFATACSFKGARCNPFLDCNPADFANSVRKELPAGQTAPLSCCPTAGDINGPVAVPDPGQNAGSAGSSGGGFVPSSPDVVCAGTNIAPPTFTNIINMDFNGVCTCKQWIKCGYFDVACADIGVSCSQTKATQTASGATQSANMRCGDGKCDTGETAVNCPNDCSGGGQVKGVCGDGTCDGSKGETAQTCPRDCQAQRTM